MLVSSVADQTWLLFAAADDPSAQLQKAPEDPTASAAGTSASDHSMPDPFQANNTVPPAARGWQARLSQLSDRILKLGPEQAQLILFFLHIMLISLALLTLQPIKPRLARLACTYFLQTSILCSGCKVSRLNTKSLHHCMLYHTDSSVTLLLCVSSALQPLRHKCLSSQLFASWICDLHL